MKILLSLALIFVFGLSVKILAQSEIILFKEGIGVENIEVGKSNANNVIASYGMNYELIEHRGFSYEIKFKKQCLSFYYKYNDKSEVIFNVSIKPPCKAITTKGIILGESTLQDVINIYGKTEPLSAPDSGIWNCIYSGVGFNVLFSSWQEPDNLNFTNKKVIEIEITKPEDFQPLTEADEDEKYKQ